MAFSSCETALSVSGGVRVPNYARHMHARCPGTCTGMHGVHALSNKWSSRYPHVLGENGRARACPAHARHMHGHMHGHVHGRVEACMHAGACMHACWGVQGRARACSGVHASRGVLRRACMHGRAGACMHARARWGVHACTGALGRACIHGQAGDPPGPSPIPRREHLS